MAGKLYICGGFDGAQKSKPYPWPTEGLVSSVGMK